jgi:hypothetical protein
MNNYILASTFYLLATMAGAQTSDSAAAAGSVGRVRPLRATVAQLQLRGTVPVMFGMSGGVAAAHQDCSHGPEGLIIIPAGSSLDTALGQIAKSNAAFEWQSRDGVADLLPAGVAPALLQVRIGRFDWDETTPVRETISRLRQLPEVSGEASRLGLKEAPIEGGMSAICIAGDCRQKPTPGPKLETEEGATLLTLLNRIVQAHSGSVWSYAEYQCGKDTLFSLEVLAE